MVVSCYLEAGVMELWSAGVLEYWVKRGIYSIFFFQHSITPILQYSGEEEASPSD